MIKHKDNLKILVNCLKDSFKLISHVPVISTDRSEV